MEDELELDFSAPTVFGPTEALDEQEDEAASSPAEASPADVPVAAREAPPPALPPIVFRPPPVQVAPPPAAPDVAAHQASQAAAYNAAGNGHSLGLSFLLAGIGTWIGGTYYGFHGGVGGALAGGATANTIRSYRYSKLGTQEGKKEAVISMTSSLLGFALASYLLYQGYKKKTAPRSAEGTES
jgi:hypothetical protein